MKIYFKGKYYFISKEQLSQYIPLGLVCYYKITQLKDKTEIRFYDFQKNEIRPRTKRVEFRYSA